MRRPALVLALSLSPLAATASTNAVAAPVVADRIVAIVGATPITLSDLEERSRPILAMAKKKAPADQLATIEKQLAREMLDHLIDEMLIARAAARAKVTVSEAELQ